MTISLANLNLFFLIPSVWMLCYGGGIFIGSHYSIKEIRWLGALFILAGSITLFDPQWNQLFLMLTFGIGHVILGLIILFKYNRTSQAAEND